MVKRLLIKKIVYVYEQQKARQDDTSDDDFEFDTETVVTNSQQSEDCVSKHWEESQDTEMTDESEGESLPSDS